MTDTTKLAIFAPALFLGATFLSGCVNDQAPMRQVMEADCPGDSELINGECVGVDEDGNPK